MKNLKPIWLALLAVMAILQSASAQFPDSGTRKMTSGTTSSLDIRDSSGELLPAIFHGRLEPDSFVGRNSQGEWEINIRIRTEGMSLASGSQKRRVIGELFPETQERNATSPQSHTAPEVELVIEKARLTTKDQERFPGLAGDRDPGSTPVAVLDVEGVVKFQDREFPVKGLCRVRMITRGRWKDSALLDFYLPIKGSDLGLKAHADRPLEIRAWVELKEG